MKLSMPWWLPIGGAPEISPQEFKQWQDEKRPLQIVDARTAEEYQQGTIGKARHAPVTQMPGSMSQLELDPNTPVVVVCLSGHRSAPGTRWLQANGFQAFSLRGGISAWRQAGYALQKPQKPTGSRTH